MDDNIEISSQEQSRLTELYNLDVLDIGREARFDRFTVLVADVFKMPIALITVMDLNTQWFKSCFGIDMDQSRRDTSFCTFALHEKDILVVEDAVKDSRFVDNVFVVNEPHLRFYAGAVLRGPTGKAVGTLCLFDVKIRSFNEEQKNQLIQFAKLVEHELLYNYHLKMMREKVEKSLYYDELTGLPNKRLFNEKLIDTISTVKNFQIISVISLKITKFSTLETLLSSEKTASLLNEITQRLKQRLPMEGVISSWQKDHFLIFMSQDTQHLSQSDLVINLLSAFEAPFVINNESHYFSCTMGIATFPLDTVNATELVHHAILARQLITHEDSLPYRFFSITTTEEIAKEVQLEQALIKAVNENEIEIYYQPKINSATQEICGAEALARWSDIHRGAISPGVFVPLAEKTDLIITLGEHVLRKTCEMNKRWQDQGLKKIPVSVNVSKKQLCQSDFHDDVKRILQETQLDPHYLDLEITESALINMDEVLPNLQRIRDLGVTLSLDDFGTGFSSLSYLQKLPIQTLKIDQSFICHVMSNEKDALMVRATIVLAHNLDLHCVAEGVETQQQFDFLKESQCDQIQGYFFSAALNEAEFEKLIS